jgi:uncharacterized protein YecT (DUF1311 family)
VAPSRRTRRLNALPGRYRSLDAESSDEAVRASPVVEPEPSQAEPASGKEDEKPTTSPRAPLPSLEDRQRAWFALRDRIVAHRVQEAREHSEATSNSSDSDE